MTLGSTPACIRRSGSPVTCVQAGLAHLWPIYRPRSSICLLDSTLPNPEPVSTHTWPVAPPPQTRSIVDRDSPLVNEPRPVRVIHSMWCAPSSDARRSESKWRPLPPRSAPVPSPPRSRESARFSRPTPRKVVLPMGVRLYFRLLSVLS